MQLFKTIHTKLFAFILSTLILCTSCGDFFDMKSNQFMDADEYTIHSANDTVYSVMGILTKMQKLSDKYVLIGELRGDLLTTTAFTDEELKKLNSFTLDSNSSFSDKTDYYAVINNCNYFLSKVDTSISVKGYKPFLNELGAVKGFRAWTYLQLALNFGKAGYYEQPILKVSDSEKDYPVLSLAQIIDTLIKDVEPCIKYDLPNYGTIFTAESKYLFINTHCLLGDLYLWKAALSEDDYFIQKPNYEKAAQFYADAILKYKYANSNYEFKWTNSAFTTNLDSWSSLFGQTVGSKELISILSLTSNSNLGNTTQLPNYYKNAQLAVSQKLIDLFDEQIYAYQLSSTVTTYTYGDLRKKGSVITGSTGEFSNIPLPLKYKFNTIVLNRVGQLYLRYAEAVNRAGKPGVAFAVLKYGLNPTSLSDNKFVPTREVTPMPTYVSVFNNAIFNQNTGIHSRGCGNSVINTRYVIPLTCTTRNDSVVFVENLICDESALETAFEGNRFQDLMRISEHRNDPTFLAERIASAHQHESNFLGLLSVKSNWFLPFKE